MYIVEGRRKGGKDDVYGLDWDKGPYNVSIFFTHVASP
jgi:hypothetical protein